MNSQLIANLLPEVYRRVDQEGSPLRASLDAMAALLTPAEEVLEQLDKNFSIDECSDEQLSMLAHWTNLDRLFDGSQDASASPWLPRQLPIEPGHLRNLIGHAAQLSRRRGTEQGLLKFLSVATGLDGFSVTSVTRHGERDPIPFHIRVIAPSHALAQEELIDRIIRQEKPAFVTYEIIYDLVEGEQPDTTDLTGGESQ